MRKITKIGFTTLALTSAVIASTLLITNTKKDIVVSEAATTRTITFDRSHTSVTTAGKNTISPHWIKQGTNASIGGSYFAVLTTKRDSQGNITTSSLLGIYGKYKFNKINKFVIVFTVSSRLETDFTIFGLSSATAVNTDQSYTPAGAAGVTQDTSTGRYTYTKTFSTPISCYGIALRAYGSISSGNYSVVSLAITYTC